MFSSWAIISLTHTQTHSGKCFVLLKGVLCTNCSLSRPRVFYFTSILMLLHPRVKSIYELPKMTTSLSSNSSVFRMLFPLYSNKLKIVLMLHQPPAQWCFMHELQAFYFPYFAVPRNPHALFHGTSSPPTIHNWWENICLFFKRVLCSSSNMEKLLSDSTQQWFIVLS